ncbi:cytochrome P450 [Streptomyces sp. 1222.5]|uniref:cytochrome P450 n=1 Tax=Streptomyces sp. 1222.5 TaxID=1881026 RepID=UPI003EBC95B2
MPDWRQHPAAVWAFTSLPFLNRPNHERIRRMVGRSFTQRRVYALRALVHKEVANLVRSLREGASDGGVVDLQDAVAFRLPIAIIAGLIGVAESDIPRFRWAFGRILRVMDLGLDEDTLAQADEACVEVTDYFSRFLSLRRSQPEDDLTSALLCTVDSQDADLTETELLNLIILLFTGGFETTALAIGTGILALLTHPEQLNLIRQDPSHAVGAAEEALRWDCVVQRVVRLAERDVELGGVEIPEGSVIGPLLGAANRDPKVFQDPDKFDIQRRGPRSLSFGGGPYGCIGMALAKMELEICFAQLAKECPTLALAGDPIRRKGSYLRGLDSLPVTLA